LHDRKNDSAEATEWPARRPRADARRIGGAIAPPGRTPRA
jgi:hypothetical protein